jgi:hypothetical protein
MFLLSLSPALGCAAGETTSNATAMTLGPASTTNASAPDDDGDGPADASTAGGKDTEIFAESSAGPGSTGDPDPSTSGPPDPTTGGPAPEPCVPLPTAGPIEPVCQLYAQRIDECFYGGMADPTCVDAYAAYCQQYIEQSGYYGGPYCAYAVLDVYVCLSQLSCAQLMDMQPDCPEQADAAAFFCGG